MNLAAQIIQLLIILMTPTPGGGPSVFQQLIDAITKLFQAATPTQQKAITTAGTKLLTYVASKVPDVEQPA